MFRTLQRICQTWQGQLSSLEKTKKTSGKGDTQTATMLKFVVR